MQVFFYKHKISSTGRECSVITYPPHLLNQIFDLIEPEEIK